MPAFAAFAPPMASAGLPSLASIGSFASGLGSLASAFGIGGDDGPGINEQMNHARMSAKQISEAQAYHSVEGRVNAARANGLHPLSVLGVPTSGEVTSFHYGGKKGPDFAAMGQGIDRALNAGRSGIQRKLDELALEKAGLENDYLRTQIAGSQKALLGNRAGAVPPVDSGMSSNNRAAAGSLNDYLKAYKSSIFGIEDGFAPRHKVMYGQHGPDYPIRVLNTDVVGDNEILMALDAASTTVPDIVKNNMKYHSKGMYRYLSSPMTPGYWIAKWTKQGMRKFKK